ncbi:MAG: imidazolonepropionase [Anaerolineae bacterium]|nr:imidazolonepropionase [Anaerolineae bacterium]
MDGCEKHQVDLVLYNALQLVTCASPTGSKRGAAMADVGVIPDGAVAILDGRIVDVGHTNALGNRYDAREQISAKGKIVCPGFVDPHTHVVYAGDRAAEFEMRLLGATYMEIMQSGGGIAGTMRATRAATVEQLVSESCSRLDAMLDLGTTTVEVKTGYGLDVASEIKMLKTIAALDSQHPVDLVPTFMGAHAVPPEYDGHVDDYVDVVIGTMLPQAAAWYRQSTFFANGIPFFCDVFCEKGVFDREQARQVLRAGKTLGMRPKLHADEFESLGGVSMAVELDAVSVDHLDVTPVGDILTLAASDTVGVIMPAVNFNLGSAHFANARAIVDAGAAVALATDLNPGSAPCPSMPLVMAIACRYGHLLPAEALNASTINAAYAVGLEKHVGSIEVGKWADLLVLDVPDYRHLAYQFGGNLIESVIKKGKIRTIR